MVDDRGSRTIRAREKACQSASVRSFLSILVGIWPGPRMSMTTSDSSSDSLGQLFLIRDSSPRIQGVIKEIGRAHV